MPNFDVHFHKLIVAFGEDGSCRGRKEARKMGGAAVVQERRWCGPRLGAVGLQRSGSGKWEVGWGGDGRQEGVPEHLRLLLKELRKWWCLF